MTNYKALGTEHKLQVRGQLVGLFCSITGLNLRKKVMHSVYGALLKGGGIYKLVILIMMIFPREHPVSS